MKHSKAFTLIELLVVISIISLLSSVVLASLNTARAKGRDAQRKATLRQLANANELRYSTVGTYSPTAGLFGNPSHGGLDTNLAPTYIPVITNDPKFPTTDYVYWRFDYSEPTCTSPAISSSDLDINKYGFYAKLENPSASDLATLGTNTLDQCLKNQFGYTYKMGN